MSDAFLIDATGAILFEGVLIREERKGAQTVSDHPIEDGSDIADHLQPQPETLSLEIGVSDAPVTGEAREGRTTELYDALDALRRSRQLVAVSTSQGLYLGYALTEISRARDVSSGRGARVPVILREVRVTQSSTVPVPPEILAATVRATGKGKDKDQQADKAASPKETKAGRRSLLKGLVTAVRGGGGDA